MIIALLEGNWPYIFVAFYILNIPPMLSILFWEKTNPRGALLWIVVLSLVPPVGFFLFILIGPTFYNPLKDFKAKARGDESVAELYAEQVSRVREKSGREIPEEAADFILALGRAGVRSYTDDNRVELITDGVVKFKSLIEDIEAAETSIHLEYYMVTDDRLSNVILDALERRSDEGLEVRVLFDAYGAGLGMNKRLRELKKKGMKIDFFHTFTKLFFSPRKNNRNHRKLAVIDGRVCYVGGFNIGKDYIGAGELGYWRDTAVRIEGGAVDWVQLRFLIDWRYATGEDLTDRPEYFDRERRGGDACVQIVSGGPDVLRKNPVEMQYLLMFSRARETLYMQTPFLAPDPALLNGMRLAAVSGVDVRLILPDKTRQPMTYWSNMYYANILMKSGVRVYFYRNGYMHSKALVADSFYCSVGSANLDERSMNLNFETNAMIYSREVGKQLTEAFMRDLEFCDECSTEDYARRSFKTRVKIAFARLSSSLL
ncbi:MAG: cardiolipin synthase [Thermoplasmatales archaeon]|nr:cardiolipin synthase [Thermoplasmatales archaeon]